MLEQGVIEPSDSPFCSPLLMIRKKDSSYRPVIDFRAVNQKTVFDAEPMPNVDDIHVKLAGSHFFSQMDFCKGYWQIPMRLEDKPKTAFQCPPLGLFQFCTMPFGLMNSGATYSRMMRRVLGGLTNTDNHVDDVLTFTDRWESHLDELRRVFMRVKQAGLTIKPSKCFFGYTSVEFVGHRIDQHTVKPLSGKVDQVMDAETPTTKKQLRAFLGLIGYYRRYIDGFATLSAPLTDALKGGVRTALVWGPEQTSAFEALKAKLCCNPVLRLPDLSRTFVLRTDASDVGLGAMLLQEFEDGLFPVAYASRKLNSAERNYAIVERECLAVVWSIMKFSKYLTARRFVLQVDNRPLSFLHTAKLSNPRVMRWALALQAFSFRAEAIRGSDNVGADFLSRAPGDVERDSSDRRGDR